MDAIVSGQAGVALLLDGARLASIHVDRLNEVVRRRPEEFPLLFRGARDCQVLENVAKEEVAACLERVSQRNDALHLALMALDGELSPETRRDAAADLEELLAEAGIEEYLERIFYARPLPAGADATEASSLSGSFILAATFFGRLGVLQPIVDRVSRAWEEIPEKLFQGSAEREATQAVLAREGLFRALVLTLATSGSLESFLVDGLLNPEVRKLPNHRALLQAWIAPLRAEAPARERHRLFAEEGLEEVTLGNSMRVFEKFGQVEKQKRAILGAMEKRDIRRAAKYVEELVDFHGAGEEEFACKSLCDLAMRARRLGLARFEEELLERATVLKPDDGWAWAQLGGVLVDRSKLSEALSAYDNAIKYGKALIGRTGKAEVLKAQNRLDEALSAYESVIAEFPEDVVARSGRAEVLKAQNRLDEALSAYESVIAEFPEEVVARNGRAEVLKAQNRLAEALSAYESVIAEFPENEVARNGRADVLASMHRWDEALAATPSGKPSTHQEWIGYHIRGMIFLRMGKLDEASVIFEHGIEACPRPAQLEYFRAGLALARLRRRDYQGTAEALEEIKAPTLEGFAKILRFHAFGASGDTKRAVDAYGSLSAEKDSQVVEIGRELQRRYLEGKEPLQTDQWLEEREANLLASLAQAA